MSVIDKFCQSVTGVSVIGRQTDFKAAFRPGQLHHDTHANLWSSIEVRPPVGKCHIPVRLHFIQDKPVVTRYMVGQQASTSPLQIGDVITRLDGETVYALVHTLRLQLKATGIHDSWQTLRAKMENQQRVTALFRGKNGKSVHLRKATRAKPEQKRIYDALGLSSQPGGSLKTWV